MLLAGAATAGPNVTDWMGAIGTDIAAVGTVTALVFLGIQAWRLGQQTSELRRQNEAEVEARRHDANRRRAEFRSEHTPFLSVEAGQVAPVWNAVMPGRHGVHSYLAVEITIHADGAGVAHNVIVTLLQIADPPPNRNITTEVVPFLRAPGQRALTLKCPPKVAVDETQWFRLEVRFLNMFNEPIRLAHSARFRDSHLEITDPPTYEWPWGFLLSTESS